MPSDTAAFYDVARTAIAKLEAQPRLRHDLQGLYGAALEAVDECFVSEDMRQGLLNVTQTFAALNGRGVSDFRSTVSQFDTALQGVLLWELNKLILIPAFRKQIALAVAEKVPPLWETPVPPPSAASEEFAEQGIVGIPGLVSPGEAADMVAHLERCETQRDHTTLHHKIGDVVNTPYVFRFATDERVLNLVHNFLGAPPTAVQMDAWWSLAESDEPWGAQVFHRDRDDFLACKLFIYLNDVAANDGPHILVRGSHRMEAANAALAAKNRTDQIGAFFTGNCRGVADQIESVFGAAVSEITGQAGTSFLENTYCFHRGKVPKAGKRCIFQVTYATIVYPERLARWIDSGLSALPGDCAKGERSRRCVRYALNASLKSDH